MAPFLLKQRRSLMYFLATYLNRHGDIHIQSRNVSKMNDIERLESKFSEALASRDKTQLNEIHTKAIGLVSGHEAPPVISGSKKAYQQLIHSYVCHVASNDSKLPYLLWWRAYYGDQKLPKKPRHSVERSRLHLREMKKYSQLTSRLCNKYRVNTLPK